MLKTEVSVWSPSVFLCVSSITLLADLECKTRLSLHYHLLYSPVATATVAATAVAATSSSVHGSNRSFRSLVWSWLLVLCLSYSLQSSWVLFLCQTAHDDRAGLLCDMRYAQ